jgi:hypothetical protein
MASNGQKKIQGSKVVSPNKLLLTADDPLTKILKKELFEIVDPNSLNVKGIAYSGDSGEYQFNDGAGDSNENPDTPSAADLEAPTLDDITLVSKTMKTDKNGNQYVEFKFSVKNHVGDQVIGVNGYGQ